VGDVYKYTLNRGTPIYLTVVECIPLRSFSYDEQCLPMGDAHFDRIRARDLRDQTTYSLHAHPEGVIVEISRREEEILSLVQRFTGSRASHAANMLVFALSSNGFYPNKIFANQEAFEHEGFTVRRDDSLC
jgi:hypothetical protein